MCEKAKRGSQLGNPSADKVRDDPRQGCRLQRSHRPHRDSEGVCTL